MLTKVKDEALEEIIFFSSGSGFQT